MEYAGKHYKENFWLAFKTNQTWKLKVKVNWTDQDEQNKSYIRQRLRFVCD